jgi:thymidine kinase
MAKLYFYYAAMNAAIDTRAGLGRIRSRIGLEAPAEVLSTTDNLYRRVEREHGISPIACVLVDEAQFLTPAQVEQAAGIVDTLGIPVLCYGLRTDFQAHLFPGSAALLALADDLIELKTICHCGRKATMNLRTGPDGKAVHEGAQVEIGGNERYIAVCRRHFKEALGRA